MHDIKEVSRLRLLGLSQRMIAKQCRMSRNTVQKVFKMLDL
jgi:DNA-binding transcriptional regulator YhcF (GntR family)